MRFRLLTAGLAFAAAAVAWGQSAAPLAFEVASVKLSPTRPAQFRPARPGADRIEWQHVTLWYCISYAYGVHSYQMSGPDWLKFVHYDISAKGPAGTTREQLPEMMRTLLADRFKLEIHREARDIPALTLVVGKDGPKLQPSAPEVNDALVGMSASREGGERMEVKGGTMTTLVNTLTGLLGRPVLDHTGLSGRYDFTLDYSCDQTAGGAQGGGYNEPPALPPSPPGAEPGLSIYSSIQRIGLRLDGQKRPLDVVVIDRAEKVPTEN
jgi:uncharacterized protein (TIGR03435 family)